MKKKWLTLIVATCLIGIAFSGCAGTQTASQETAEVTRGDLVISVPVSGNLEMPHKTDLSFGTTGVVKEVLVDEGDNVAEGQKLAQLDARSLELNVAVAQADYESAQINLMRTIYPYYTKTWGVDLAGVWLALGEAQDNVAEARKILNEGRIDEAYVLLDLIEENLTKAEKKSLATQWDLPWSVRLLELQVDKAEAALNSAKLNLAKATIVAPFDAVVADVTIAEGKELSGMTYGNPAISLVDTSEIEMKGVIDEIDIAMVKPGQEADIILDALPDKEIKGKVTFISQIGTVVAGVVGYDTTITLENPDEELRDGMSATAEIISERHDDVLLLPNRAIRGSLENPVVVVITDGQTEERKAALGLSDGINSEVLSGLKEGERVVLPPVQRPSAGGGF